MPKDFKTLPQLLNQSVGEHSANEAFGETTKDGSWRWTTYREFGTLVDNARGGLAARGVQKGDRVAIISDNRLEWAVLAFASYSLGASYVPMYEAQSVSDWSFILQDSGAKVVIAATGDIDEKLLAVQGDLPDLTHVISLALPEADPRSYGALLTDGKKFPAAPADVTPDDLASLIYTSGTTGKPKGVRLSHGNLCTNVLASGQRFHFGPGDRSLAFLPWAHAFGQTAELFTLFFYGATLAINDAVPNLVGNLAVVKPTVLVAVPRIFNRIYDGVNKQMAGKPAIIQSIFRGGIAAASKKSRGESIGLFESLILSVADKLIFSKVRLKFGGRLRFVVSGSAALSPSVAEFIDALGIDVFEGYGLTETSPVVTANYSGHRKIGSVGLPVPGVKIRLDHTATGDAVNGEIIVSGPNIMQGYHNRPEDTAQVILPDGSFRTGDMGRIDSDGFLFITGRIKEQYKLENGKYVVPSPLEEELKLSPYVVNCMLHGANKPHNVVLLVPEMQNLEAWALKSGITLGDVTKNPAVKSLLEEEMEKYSASFKGYEKPRAIAVISEDFTQENNMLTPSMKVKRQNVLAAYGDLLESLYG